MRMSESSYKFRLPVKKLSVKGDLTIRARLLRVQAKKGLRQGPYHTFLTYFLAPVLAILIIFPFARLGINNYVYGNKNIVRGDLLYGWKRDIELDKLHAMKNPVNRANYFLQLSEWRMREADVAFEREVRGDYSFLIPTARADGIVIRLSIDSISEGLIAEGVIFFQKSISETKRIPKDKQSPVVRRMKETMAINAYLLDEIAQQISVEDSNDLIIPIRNQYLEIARDWNMEAFPERPMHQDFELQEQMMNEPMLDEPMHAEMMPPESVLHEPPPHEPPIEALSHDQMIPEEFVGFEHEEREEMGFIEPEIVDFRFYGDEWSDVKQHHEEFDKELRHFEEEYWDWSEEEIRHFEEQERRMQEEEMRLHEEEMRRFEEEFFQEMQRLEEDWQDDFIHPGLPHEGPLPDDAIHEPCPDEFQPVCGELEVRQETFHNECELHRSGAHFLHEGECAMMVP